MENLTNVKTWQVISVFLLVAGFLSAGLNADTLNVTEHQVTSTSAYETTPTLGNDGVSDLVVFTSRELLGGGGFDQGDIWYQRLIDGAPEGSPVMVINGPTDDQLNDVSGDYIVYTAYDSTTSLSGSIRLYQISTSLLYPIGNAPIIEEPRIHGTRVVWREGGMGATRVMMYDLAWLGTSKEAVSLAGPIPPTFAVEIGDRFVVWSELVSGQFDIAAFDLDNVVRIDITSTSAVHEHQAGTNGAWIVWKAQDEPLVARIEARNMDTTDTRVVVDNGAMSRLPNIDDDLINPTFAVRR